MRFSVVGPIALAAALTAGPACNEPNRFPGERHLTNIRKLSQGARQASGRISADEQRVVYQAAHGNMRCTQLYVMDIDGRNKRRALADQEGARIGPLFLPDDGSGVERIVFASTHAGGSFCPKDRSGLYDRSLHPDFDLYSANLDGSNLRRLTDTRGFDGEASLSPNGETIVFTSMRDGDPELYAVNVDGTNPRRLTRAKGYDGQASWSADGSRIVWVASRPTTAAEIAAYETLLFERAEVHTTRQEVYTMDADGTNARRVTELNKSARTPVFHPDGERIVFSVNMNIDFVTDYDLHVVRRDGTGRRRITTNPTPEMWPMFLRDGKQLIFSSSRSSDVPGERNVFISEWIEY